ncbi:MAG: SemiSWEET transporter [Myxococcales bacterium]|nr:SemiSWEET transporter [Myxococcales bacterium]
MIPHVKVDLGIWRVVVPEWLGLVAAFLTTASFVPQVVKVVRTRQTTGLSVGMYSMFSTGVALWVVYGITIGSRPVILANAFTLALCLPILCLLVRR